MTVTTTRRSPSTAPQLSWLSALAVVTLLAACAERVRQRSTPSVSIAPKLNRLSFQVELDSELYEVASAAAAAWSSALGVDVSVSPDGDIPIVLVPSLLEECGGGASARACSDVRELPSDSWIQIKAAIHPSVRYGVVLHEMGHHLRRAGGHLEAVAHAVMSKNRALSDITILPEDAAFICEGGRMDCWSAEAPA